MDIHNIGNNKLPKDNFKRQDSENVPELIADFVAEISNSQNSSQIY